MKTHLSMSLFIILIVSAIIVPQQSNAQESAIQAGDWLLTNENLTVYARANDSSTQVTTLPAGLKVRVVREPVAGNGGQWFYVDEHAFGWVFQPASTAIFMPFSDTLPEKLINQYTERIETDPEDLEAYKLRAMMYYNTKAYLKAVEDMQVYIDSLEFGEAGLWEGWLGRFYIVTGDADLMMEAGLHLSLARFGPSGNDDLMLAMQEALLEDKDGFVTITREFYSEATQIAPDWAILYNNWGNRLFKENETEALRLYEQAIEVDPELDRPYSNIALFYANRGEYDTALEYHDQAIAANPFNGVAYELRAGTYMAQSRVSDALDDYLKAIEIDPENGRIRLAFGTYHLQMGNFRQAVEQLELATELDATNRYAFSRKATAYAYLGEYEEAAAAMDVAIVLNNRLDSDYSIVFRASEIYLEVDRFEDVVNELEPYVYMVSNPSDSAWWVVASVMLGRAQVELGQYDEALATYERAFDFNRNVALNYTGWVGSYRNVVVVTDEEVQRAQRAADADPNNGELYFELGKEQLELGLWTDAIANFRTYNLLSDDVPEGFMDFVNSLEDLVLQR